MQICGFFRTKNANVRQCPFVTGTIGVQRYLVNANVIKDATACLQILDDADASTFREWFHR